MADHPISDKNGKETEFFWSDTHAADPKNVTVFRRTIEGLIKKMRGVHFDSKAGKIVKE